MKVWGDPCKPWFEESSTRGQDALSNFRTRMRLVRDEDGVPYRDIVYFLQEYMKQVKAIPTTMGGVHLDILSSWAMVQGGMGMAVKPMGIPPTPGLGARPAAPKLASRPQAQLPPGAAGPKVGDIITPPGSMPHRVTAVLPELEVLTPVARMPPPGRALPAPKPPPGSAIVKAPTPAVPAPKAPTVPAPSVPTPPRPAAPLALKPAPQVTLSPDVLPQFSSKQAFMDAMRQRLLAQRAAGRPRCSISCSPVMGSG